ncbi:MAG: YtxH domain-containing protein [Chloroflexi bacterium]|nr:MAG: YtxH domain-containing protein [Chloroflexota bacterium]
MGYVRGVFHGLVIGGAVALLYAPKPGRQTRRELQERLDQMRGQMQPALDKAQAVVQQARPQVEQAVSKAQQQAQKITRRGPLSSSSYAGPASMGTGGSPAPGV